MSTRTLDLSPGVLPRTARRLTQSTPTSSVSPDETREMSLAADFQVSLPGEQSRHVVTDYAASSTGISGGSYSAL